MSFYDSSCKPAIAALFFRRGADDSPPHPPGADHTPRARRQRDLTIHDMSTMFCFVRSMQKWQQIMFVSNKISVLMKTPCLKHSQKAWVQFPQNEGSVPCPRSSQLTTYHLQLTTPRSPAPCPHGKVIFPRRYCRRCPARRRRVDNPDR